MIKKNNKGVKITIILIVIFIPIIIVLLDILNITKIIPLTNKYDWLAFIGTYISGLCTISLGIISIKQNDSLSNVNTKMLNNNMITTRFSQIELEKSHYYDATLRSYDDNYYGITMMKNIKANVNKYHYNRLILQFRDNKSLPLMYGKIDKIEIYYNYEKPYVNESKKVYISNGEEVKLEVTPLENNITYYLPICIFDEDDELGEIFKSKKLRIVATIEVKNAFNVVFTADFTVHLNKGIKANSSDWTEYILHGRKIYFKKISYDEDE